MAAPTPGGERGSQSRLEQMQQRSRETRALIALASPSELGRAMNVAENIVSFGQRTLTPQPEETIAGQALRQARGAIVTETLGSQLSPNQSAAERVAQAQEDLHVDAVSLATEDAVRRVLWAHRVIIPADREDAQPAGSRGLRDGTPGSVYRAAAGLDLLIVDSARAIRGNTGDTPVTVTVEEVRRQRNPEVLSEPVGKEREVIAQQIGAALEPIAAQYGFASVDALLAHAASQIAVTDANLDVLNALDRAQARIVAIHEAASHLLVNSSYRRAHDGGRDIIGRLAYAHPSRQANVAREMALQGITITPDQLRERIADGGQYRADVEVTHLRVAQMVSSLARTFGVPEAPANGMNATARYVDFVTQAQADIAQMPAAMDAYFADATLQGDTLLTRAGQFRIPTEGRDEADIRHDVQRVQDVIWLSLAEELNVASTIGSVDPSATRSLVIAHLTNEVANDLALAPETERVMDLAERALAAEQLHIYARRTILPTVDVTISPFRQDGTRVSEPAAQEYLDHHPVHRRRARRDGALPPIQ